MEFIKIFIIVQVIFLLFQFIRGLRLEWYQYSELVFGSFLIIVFFGLLGSMIMLDKSLINNSALFASLYAIWFYLTKKFTNSINSDRNGVIYT